MTPDVDGPDDIAYVDYFGGKDAGSKGKVKMIGSKHKAHHGKAKVASPTYQDEWVDAEWMSDDPHFWTYVEKQDRDDIGVDQVDERSSPRAAGDGASVGEEDLGQPPETCEWYFSPDEGDGDEGLEI